MLNLTTLLSIFRRKGGESQFTTIVNNSLTNQNLEIFSQLVDNEIGLILSIKDKENWCLLRVCFEKEKKRIKIMKKESICRNLWCQIINYKRWKK